jgi:hypothetical protein
LGPEVSGFVSPVYISYLTKKERFRKVNADVTAGDSHRES